MTIRRKSSLAAAKRIQVQVTSDAEDAPKIVKKVVRKTSTRVDLDASWTNDAPPSEEAPRPAKRLKTSASSRNEVSQLNGRLFGYGTTNWKACAPPARRHAVEYHRPLLLDGEQGRAGRDVLLKWFDSVSAARAMPWRKAWIDPQEYSDAGELRRVLERRAYEVWISEIMLQQTRVSVVIDYWNRWMAKWPTIQDLAKADEQDVLSAWRGLGYYSRATRIHTAAQKVVNDKKMNGLLPETAEELEANVPGVGRYTGGAISAIVFGHAAPMVDGNVLRVLSRQLGILGNVKTDKTVISSLWAAADALVKAVAEDASEGTDVTRRSDGPGRWGQGLMELGSTVCAPKPNCSACPVTSTCRAYGEGLLVATKTKKDSLGDIEELCNLCEPMEEVDAASDEKDGDEDDGFAEAKTKKKPQGKKQATLSSFFGQSGSTAKSAKTSTPGISGKTLEVAVEHARKFPVKAIKKAVREEETIVCAIRRSDGSYLIQRRPDKGLLAGLWELPSLILPGTNDSTPKLRKKAAQEFVSGLLSSEGKGRPKDQSGKLPAGLRHVGELGSVPWLFSHIKLTMHVQFFELETETGDAEAFDISGRLSRWASGDDIEQETMGTGMRQCWTLAKEVEL